MKKVLTSAFMLLSFAVFSQYGEDSLYVEKASRISLKAGSGFISGDGSEAQLGATFGVGYERDLTSSLMFVLNLDAGILGRGPYSEAYTYSSRTSFFQLSANIKYNLLKPEKDIKLAPFIGLGVVSYNAQVSEGGSVVRVANGSPANPNSAVGLAIPVGFELSKAFGESRIGFEYVLNYLTTDKFDGTVGTDGATFDGHKSTGLIDDLDAGSTGKTFNDLWTGFRLVYTKTLGGAK